MFSGDREAGRAGPLRVFCKGHDREADAHNGHYGQSRTERPPRCIAAKRERSRGLDLPGCRHPQPSGPAAASDAWVGPDGGAFGMVPKATLPTRTTQRGRDASASRASGRVGPGPPFQMAGSSEARSRLASGRAVGLWFSPSVHRSTWSILERRFFQTSWKSVPRLLSIKSRSFLHRFVVGFRS